MKRFILPSMVLALSLGSAARAETGTLQAEDLPAYERVGSIPALGGLRSFRAIDKQTLIVWANAFDPYLVKLEFPSFDLEFTHAIAIDSATSRIYERFDSVRIGGLRYPIGEIYKLSREEAKQLKPV